MNPNTPSTMILIEDFDQDRVDEIIRSLERGLDVGRIRVSRDGSYALRLFLSLPSGAYDEEAAGRIAARVAAADGGNPHTEVIDLGQVDWRRERPTHKIEGALVSVSDLLLIPGLRGEHLSIGTYESRRRIEKLAGSMSERGFLSENPVIIVVAPPRDARVYEGNHRIRAAALACIESIPTDIYFLRGAEADGYPL